MQKNKLCESCGNPIPLKKVRYGWMVGASTVVSVLKKKAQSRCYPHERDAEGMAF